MSAGAPRPVAEAISTGFRLADGQWHRLHPLTPLLRGGVAFVAIVGILLVNLRDFVIQIVIGGPDYGEDPVQWIVDNGYVAAALALVALGLVLFTLGFYVSWRMHTFRITDELVEVRSGVLFRKNRRGRLDRIQGVNITRPLLARVFGAAKLEVNVAGHDANVQLSYLGSAAADELRREILLLASGTQTVPGGEAPVSLAGLSASDKARVLVEQRAREFLAPELAPDAAAPQSVVQMHLGRLLGSIVLSESTVFVLLIVAGLIVTVASTHELFFLFAFVPGIIGMGSYYVSKFTRSVRYSIAATPDGVRVGFGLLSTSNETLPPGRIHAVQVRQPLLWRAPGWWEITINRAASSHGSGSERQAQTTILPVGNLTDVRKVLDLVLPGHDLGLVQPGMTGTGADGFTNSPRRGAILRWFSWRRNGFATAGDLVFLRRGAVWRELVIVPLPRAQSVSLYQGPLLRRLRLASVHVHTVAGHITARLGALDASVATTFFTETVDAAIRAATNDTSHRWRSSPPTRPRKARPAPVAPAPAGSRPAPVAQAPAGSRPGQSPAAS
ncbi:MAG: PH domain-containing protein [Rhodoglobus sp.]